MQARNDDDDDDDADDDDDDDEIVLFVHCSHLWKVENFAKVMVLYKLIVD